MVIIQVVYQLVILKEIQRLGWLSLVQNPERNKVLGPFFAPGQYRGVFTLSSYQLGARNETIVFSVFNCRV